MRASSSRLVGGHDIHQLLARLHHATHGLRRQSDHLAGGRGTISVRSRSALTETNSRRRTAPRA